MEQKRHDSIPVMDYRQYRRARRLVHECCNYDCGNCIALDDGEECICVQSISLVLVYKCGQEKLNNLYYQVKEQRRCS
uniref:cysteine-rich VLP protein n=3 Tax=Enterocloster clostridioformis TaxID=1531 RepID=UPI0025A5184E